MRLLRTVFETDSNAKEMKSVEFGAKVNNFTLNSTMKKNLFEAGMALIERKLGEIAR